MEKDELIQEKEPREHIAIVGKGFYSPEGVTMQYVKDGKVEDQIHIQIKIDD